MKEAIDGQNGLSAEQDKIIVCQKTNFSKLLAREVEENKQYKFGHAPVHIIKISEDEPSFLALVDFPLNGDKLGKLLCQIAPDNYYYKFGIEADWEMPDRQQYSDNQRLLNIHRSAFPIEWPQFERDRKRLLDCLNKKTTLFSLISWKRKADGQRDYDLESLSPKLGQICYPLLRSFSQLLSPRLGNMYGNWSQMSEARSLNPLVGLIAAAYLQPEIYKKWDLRMELPKGEYAQKMMAAQMPLLVLIKKDEILQGKIFERMEEYAQKSSLS